MTVITSSIPIVTDAIKTIVLHNLPKKQVKAKKGKHDDGISNYPCGVADLVQQEEPLIYKPVQGHNKVLNHTVYRTDNRRTKGIKHRCVH